MCYINGNSELGTIKMESNCLNNIEIHHQSMYPDICLPNYWFDTHESIFFFFFFLAVMSFLSQGN